MWLSQDIFLKKIIQLLPLFYNGGRQMCFFSDQTSDQTSTRIAKGGDSVVSVGLAFC